MNRLIELHEKVKDHPYRASMSERHLKSYLKSLYDLSHEFAVTVMETEYKASVHMTHDFNGCIATLEYERSSQERRANAIIHIERCIGIIHTFMDTGKVLEYWSYYSGDRLEHSPRVKKHIYENGEYHLGLSRKDKQACLDEIESYNQGKEWPEYGIYSRGYYDIIAGAIEDE